MIFLKEVKKEIELLEMIYQNILMIKNEISTIIKIEGVNSNLVLDLKNILGMYNKIIHAINGMLKNRKQDITSLGIGEKMINYMSIKLNITESSKTEDIANMIIQDITVKTDSLKKILSEYSLPGKTIINLSNRIFFSNEKSCEMLKKYIKK